MKSLLCKQKLFNTFEEFKVFSNIKRKYFGKFSLWEAPSKI